MSAFSNIIQQMQLAQSLAWNVRMSRGPASRCALSGFMGEPWCWFSVRAPTKSIVIWKRLETTPTSTHFLSRRSVSHQLGRCCQTNANQSPLPLPQLLLRQREGRAPQQERRRGSACRCCGLGGGAPWESGCGPRHGLKRTSVKYAYAGTATSPALFVGTAGASSRLCC
jgi:hypothetical protein